MPWVGPREAAGAGPASSPSSPPRRSSPDNDRNGTLENQPDSTVRLYKAPSDS
ncbi:hypothetical protein FB563_2217 [Streptomyces puniciscabiei]|uniref:Uncharacterized protein n=1 Tax=Streptomyces puniciscabiei TaxID=164348 RepID=A0A542UDU6_9ACTN|nr:hypothetical protein [Streptomyces puniciscabiei]TQK97254.1 hypothetical protein FB563_2217 [Streptomyces puniciscabiei]